MTRKRKRRSSIVEMGNGPSRVRIYTIKRRDGYDQFTLAWKEGGRRNTRCLSSMDEARMIAQQVTVRLANGGSVTDEVTKRDIELLHHCERLAKGFSVTLAAAMDEWVSARRAAGEIAISDAVRFYQANRKDLLITKTLAQVAEEFIESRRAAGNSEIHVRNCTDYLGRLTGQMKSNIADVTATDITRFLQRQETLGPVSRNSLRGTIVSMFRFAKRRGYLHPDRDTAADMTDSFKVPESEITIFTAGEMGRLLLAAHARILPLVAIGAFAGIRSAEIRRLHWEDIKWDWPPFTFWSRRSERNRRVNRTWRGCWQATFSKTRSMLDQARFAGGFSNAIDERPARMGPAQARRSRARLAWLDFPCARFSSGPFKLPFGQARHRVAWPQTQRESSCRDCGAV